MSRAAGLWFAIVLLFLQLDTSAQTGYAAPGGIWVPATTSWKGNSGTDPWTLTPRTGLIDEPFPYPLLKGQPGYNASLDTVVRQKFDKYYINEKVQGFLEYLPEGYNINTTKKYPLIIYIPGCGEIHDGRVYTHKQLNGSITPNWNYGLFRLMKTDGGTEQFRSLPRELVRNGDYFSNIPLKTPGTSYSNYAAIPKQGVIVMCLMISHVDATVCGDGKYYNPTRFDVDKAIELAKVLYKDRIDLSRIYLTGMSAGAGVDYLYVSEDINMAKKVAAIVPVSAIENLYPDPTGSRSAVVINAGVSTMAIVNSADANFQVADNNTYTINKLKASPNYSPGQAELYKFTNTSVSAHDAWSTAYKTRYLISNNYVTQGGTYTYTDAATNEKYTTYEWMLTRQNLSLLPVDVTSFTASRMNTSVRLDWATSMEMNSKDFILERSLDGTSFSSLATLPAAGNSNTNQRYSYTDANLPQGRYVYYRLSQSDLDGRSRIIGIRKVYLGTTGIELSLYPSVATTNVNLEIQGIANEAMTMRVMDMTGKLLLQQVVPPRQNRLAIDVSKFGKGMYLVQLTGTNTNLISKFVKQ